jgi:hypothetical protein
LGFRLFRAALLNGRFPSLYPASDAGATDDAAVSGLPARAKAAFKIPSHAHRSAAGEPKCRRNTVRV